MAPLSKDERGVQFTAPLADIKCARSGDPESKGRWKFVGQAAVFNRKSHDLGGFRTVIDPAFFDNILDADPAVHLVWDHDMRWVLGYTRNKSLELSVNPGGLRSYAQFPATATAEECATLLAGGFIDQMSFACDIALDRWEQDENGEITRYLLDCSGLYDVTICAQGAFPQTNSQLLASVHDASAILASAQEAGRVIRREQDPDLVADAAKLASLVLTGRELLAEGESADDIAQNLEGVSDVADRAERFAALRERAESLLAGTEAP